jgi:hypothetical protein
MEDDLELLIGSVIAFIVVILFLISSSLLAA